MVAADHDRRLDHSGAHELVHLQPEARAISVSEPTDARGQPLERDTLARHADPSHQRRIIPKHVKRESIGHMNVVGISGERGPAERTFALTEQRSHIFRHEARNVKRVLDARALRLRSDVVAVVERRPHRAA